MMRIKMLSALGVLVFSICSSRPANAQANLVPPQLPASSNQKQVDTNKLAQFSNGAADANAQARKNLENAVRALLLRTGQASGSALDGTDQTKTLAGLLEPKTCGHIMIFEAPAMDSQIIHDAPKEFASNMPKTEAMPPCPQDMPKAMFALGGVRPSHLRLSLKPVAEAPRQH